MILYFIFNQWFSHRCRRSCSDIISWSPPGQYQFKLVGEISSQHCVLCIIRVGLWTCTNSCAFTGAALVQFTRKCIGFGCSFSCWGFTEHSLHLALYHCWCFDVTVCITRYQTPWDEKPTNPRDVRGFLWQKDWKQNWWCWFRGKKYLNHLYQEFSTYLQNVVATSFFSLPH